MNPTQIDKLAEEWALVETDEFELKRRKKELLDKIVAAVEEPPKSGTENMEGMHSKITVTFKENVSYSDNDALRQLIEQEMPDELALQLFRKDYKERKAEVEAFLESGEQEEVRELLALLRVVKAGSPSVKVKRFKRG